MSQLARAREQLQEAGDLAAVLPAAHEAFVVVLTTLRAHENPDSAWFGGFVMAAASAADGRDALLFAPSMQAGRRREGRAAPNEPQAGGAGSIANDICGLSGLAAARLAQAASEAADPGDRAACEQAARCARRIGELLAGA